MRFERLDLVGNRRWFFLGSGVVLLASLLLLAIPPTLRPGIEFTSGTTTLIRFTQPVDQSAVRDVYAELGHDEARIQSTDDREFLIRTRELEVPDEAFISSAPPVATPPPIGPAPLEPIGTLTLGAEDAAPGAIVFLRRPFHGNVCDLGGLVAELPTGTAAEVITEHPECGAGEQTVLEVLAGNDLGYVLRADTRDFAPIEVPVEDTEPLDLGERSVIEAELEARFGAFAVLEFDTVSAVVSRVAVRNASVAVVVAALFIMGYVAFAFSSMPSPLRFAGAAILALAHDVIIVLGAFSLFGKLFGTEINLMFVTGLLTVIGFSVHDSIVVFDRIRENVQRAPDAPFRESVNTALVETMARSLNTSLTLLLTVCALLFLGGVTIQEFLLVILVGVIAGTYSSIAVAAQLLVSWDEGDFRAVRTRLPRALGGARRAS
ncbi:MAG: protein translocase subunit SecF, partial [Chloroflexi bacterium]|nr:protein translocase subunit SecF [Chloroflexota bacterium]